VLTKGKRQTLHVAAVRQRDDEAVERVGYEIARKPRTLAVDYTY
jgi:hypothetical protein